MSMTPEEKFDQHHRIITDFLRSLPSDATVAEILGIVSAGHFRARVLDKFSEANARLDRLNQINANQAAS